LPLATLKGSRVRFFGRAASVDRFLFEPIHGRRTGYYPTWTREDHRRSQNFDEAAGVSAIAGIMLGL
jgi:hypothetical protein